jgi:hypothetical protein
MPAVSCRAQAPWQELSMPGTKEILAGFKNPPPEYGPNLVWGWNGPVNEKIIERDLDLIRSLGFPSVIIEAGYRMKEPYLSDGWFRLVSYAVGQAKKRNMRVWLIDEGKYPSGFAGGKFSTERPDLRMRGLEVLQRLKPADGELLNIKLPENIISAAAHNRKDSSVILLDVSSGMLSWEVPGTGWEIILVRHRFRTSVTRAVNNPTGGKDTVNSLCDYLDPDATRQFIEFTHEGYKKYLDAEFGKTLLGFRGDEPDYGFTPWTPAIPEEFIARKGYDIKPYLATFFIPNPTDSARRAKADYWDVWSAFFAENFFRIQAEWCRENGLEYMVHMNHEDKMMRLVRSGGDFFRNMRYVQIPGVDAIWNQIWMDRVADFPKLASSAAHQNGRPRAMSESFAAYRIRPNVQQGKWVIDHQFARGINFFEIMFFGSSAEGSGKPRGWMASDSFPSLMEYTNRVSWLLSQGRPAARIAVYLPTTSMWLGDEESNTSTWEIVQQLLESQRDFDFVDDFGLEEGLALSDGRLVNQSGQSYNAVIIPATSVISKAVLERLDVYAASGGKVLFLGNGPGIMVDSVFMNSESASIPDNALYEPSGSLAPQVMDALPDPDVSLDPASPAVKYTHRKLKNSELYFMFNESNDPVRCKATLQGTGEIYLLDPQNGEIEKIDEYMQEEDKSTLDLNFDPWGSMIFLIDRVESISDNNE